MERWTGRVALVTGASSGIGLTIAEDLARAGMKVVGCARQINKIKELASSLDGEPGSIFAIKCDLTKDEEVYDMFKKIEDSYGGVDICINNAGMCGGTSFLDGTLEEWRKMTDLNIIALCLCTKLAVASMRKRSVDDGHIINISSLAGHIVTNPQVLHFYAGTKHAVRAITEGLRQELREAHSQIRASLISPGIVRTNFHHCMHPDDPKAAGQYYKKFDPLKAVDISQSIFHIISAPPHVEINDIILRPTRQLL